MSMDAAYPGEKCGPGLLRGVSSASDTLDTRRAHENSSNLMASFTGILNSARGVRMFQLSAVCFNLAGHHA